jgi:hypothetical protein
MKRGVTYKVTGQVQPRVAGIKVVLDDGITQVAGVTAEDGKFEIEVTPMKVGAKQFSIVTETEAGFIGSKSSSSTVLVR